MPIHNLPPSPTSFIGRENELAEIAEILATPACRLLTLSGPGGIGKTRLAVQVARQQDTFADGVYFFGLQSVRTADLIIPFMASCLNYQFYNGIDSKQQMLRFLRDKHMLLLLDNFEHLLDGANLISELLLETSHLQLLVTSREVLNLREEWLYTVKGMDFPESDVQDIAGYSAVRLFVERARQIRHGFLLQHEQTAVARITQLVEGMPLALELAAAWLKSLSCRDIADQISSNLGFLTTTMRDVLPKHRSIRAVFDHSWDILSAEEQSAFIKLTVFRGSCTRQAAEQLTEASLLTLTTLVDKSLIRRTAGDRYEIHELLRQYGEEHLEASEISETVRDAHSKYYLNALIQREVDVKGRRQLEALDEIEIDFANVRDAWTWAARQKDYDSIGRALECLYWFCVFRSLFQEGADLLDLIVRQPRMVGSLAERHWGRVNSRRIGLFALGSIEHATGGSIEQSLQIAQQYDLPQGYVPKVKLGSPRV